MYLPREDQSGAAAALSAWPVVRRLRAYAGAVVPRQRGRALTLDGHPAHAAVAGRPPGVHGPHLSEVASVA